MMRSYSPCWPIQNQAMGAVLNREGSAMKADAG